MRNEDNTRCWCDYCGEELTSCGWNWGRDEVYCDDCLDLAVSKAEQTRCLYDFDWAMSDEEVLEVFSLLSEIEQEKRFDQQFQGSWDYYYTDSLLGKVWEK